MSAINNGTYVVNVAVPFVRLSLSVDFVAMAPGTVKSGGIHRKQALPLSGLARIKSQRLLRLVSISLSKVSALTADPSHPATAKRLGSLVFPAKYSMMALSRSGSRSRARRL